MGLIGVKRTIEFAKQCGIKAKIPPYPSIALGSAEIPLIEMLQAFSMYPNKGYNTEPVYVTRIEDKNGNIIKEFPVSQSKQIIGEADDYTMVKLLQGVVQYGTARRLNSYNIPVPMAGKTGTTNGNTDGWFIGFTPELLAGAWVGCEDPFIPIYQNNAGGSEMSAPEWGLFMQKVYADGKLPYNQVKEFYQPDELKSDPIYADMNFANIISSSDSLNYEEDMNDANDFLGDSENNSSEPVSAPDKKEAPSKPAEKGNKPAPKAVMPARDKKPVSNDY
jgi:penicillin-binding protein 1A